MAKQTRNTVFLEDWLKGVSAYKTGSSTPLSSQNHFASAASAIIQSWADLREASNSPSFQTHHLQALHSLVSSQSSLHVADPQAKLVLSILSSPSLSLPHDSYPLFLRLLYIWARKSSRPSSSLVDSVVGVVSRHVTTQFDRSNSPRLFSEGMLLLGSLASVQSASETSTRVCLELMCRLLEDKYRLLASFEGIVPDVFAGIGYALCSSASFHYVGMLEFLLGVWGREGGPEASLSHGLLILHLIEWVISTLTAWRYEVNISVFSRQALETGKKNYALFSPVMAATGVLRSLNKSADAGLRLDILSRLRVSAESCLESVASELISFKRDLLDPENDLSDSLGLQCFAMALARSGPVTPCSSYFLALTWALLSEVFPLRRFYAKVSQFLHGSSARMLDKEVQEHLGSVHFKEAGTIASVWCNQYVSADDEGKIVVENLIWNYSHHIYTEHREVALALRRENDELLMNIEKICESAFLTIVVFALSLTRQKLNSKFSNETGGDISVRILAAFSCLEYFRRILLPEYMDTIREAVLSVQENDSSCISFVESIPIYADLTNGPDLSFQHQKKYVWYKDEVQTARILFYLRVIATCVERLPSPVFGKLVAPTMCLYLGHPNGKVARASHSMFVAFMSSMKDSVQVECKSMKENLVFYYMERSLSGYPGITPFEGLASGVSAAVRHLPAGSPAISYCIHSLVEKSNSLCRVDQVLQADTWKNWQGELESSKKILDLLLRLISLVDIQVLPGLMKSLAQLIVELSNDGQVMVLNELYSMVAESDDVTRKPTLVSWLQSLSYLCFRNNSHKKDGINYAPQQKNHVSNGSLQARL